MHKLMAAVIGIAMLAAGCATAAPSTAPLTYPGQVDGIAVHRVPWNRTLPYATPSLYILWRTRAPSSYRVSPKSAIIRSLQLWPALRKLAKVIYIQPAGLVGGHTGDPRSAYVVEVAGPNLGFTGAPRPITPPQMEFELFVVDGQTGAAQEDVGGGWPPEALTTAWMPQAYAAVDGALYHLAPVAFIDASREVAAGDLADQPSTGVLITFTIQKTQTPVVIKVAGAGELHITGFKGDRLVYVESPTLGTGTFMIGSGRITWQPR